MTDVPDRPDLGYARIGDIVHHHSRPGLYRITGFYAPPTIDRAIHAHLTPIASPGPDTVSVDVRDLTVVDRPVDTRAPGTEEPTC